MKRVLLVLALPCVLVASEQKDDKTTTQKVAIGATNTAFIGAASYTGWSLATDLVRTIGSGDWIGAGWAVGKAGYRVLTIAQTTATTMEIIDPKDTRTPLQKAADESAMRRRIAEETAATDFEKCLNQHAHCMELTSHGIPKRCASPARRYGMINELATKSLIDRYKKFNIHN